VTRTPGPAPGCAATHRPWPSTPANAPAGGARLEFLSLGLAREGSGQLRNQDLCFELDPHCAL